MRFVLALAVAVCVAGVVSADMPRPVPGQRVAAPGGWCGGLMGGLAVTAGGLCLAHWLRKRV